MSIWQHTIAKSYHSAVGLSYVLKLGFASSLHSKDQTILLIKGASIIEDLQDFWIPEPI